MIYSMHAIVKKRVENKRFFIKKESLAKNHLRNQS